MSAKRDAIKAHVSACQANGWSIAEVRPEVGPKRGGLILACPTRGCTNRVWAQFGKPAPPPCECGKQGKFALEAIERYADLASKLIERRHRLRLSQDDVAQAAGLADGHINKLEVLARRADLVTLLLWVEALGGRLSFEWGLLPSTTRAIIAQRAHAGKQRPSEPPKLMQRLADGHAGTAPRSGGRKR